MHKDELTKKAHVSFHDQDEAAVVASVLADDAHFQEKARLVAAAKVSESASVAEREAKSYAPNRGAHRDLIVRLLLTQADEPWQPRGGLGRDYLPNLFRPAVWVDAPSKRAMRAGVENGGRLSGRVLDGWRSSGLGSASGAELDLGRTASATAPGRPTARHVKSA